jgi:AAA15 family ATPase/GTPase
MVAAPRLRKKQNTIKSSIDGENNFPALLKVVAIYGPNASGKSTLVRALEVLCRICHQKPSVDKKVFPISSFRFDPELLNKPSVFEVHFIVKRVRYTFELALTAERIYQESLTIYKRGNSHVLYSRSYIDGQYIYGFDAMLDGGDSLHEAWKKLTGPQTLFLAQAVANSNEELNQLKEPFEWLSGLMVESNGMRGSANITRKLIANMPSFGNEIANLMSDVDIPISAIHSKLNKKEIPGINELRELKSEETAEPGEDDRISFDRSSLRVTTTLTHQTSLGKAEFDYDEESDGTKNLMGFALPWYVFRNYENSTRCNVLVVDELDSSLHPKLVEALVERHIESGLENQLIFTTHDTHLMDSKLLRRDQIWMTERDEAGATQLRSVYEFEGRESEDVEKRYYEGRYRSLPIVKSGVGRGSSNI